MLGFAGMLISFVRKDVINFLCKSDLRLGAQFQTVSCDFQKVFYNYPCLSQYLKLYH